MSNKKMDLLLGGGLLIAVIVCLLFLGFILDLFLTLGTSGI